VALVSAQNATVLLVEDDPGDAVLVREMLADVASGIEIAWAQTLEDAERQLGDGPIACVLLDPGLPDAHGLEAVIRLRDHGVPLIVLTGEDDEQRGIASLGAGAQEYLVKGQVDASSLFRSMRYAIERAQAEAAARELLEARLLEQENARLQRGLLPTALLRDGDIRVAATYRAGRHRALLGGDFYDVVELDDHSILAIIGDVCGHGPDEAALGVLLRIAWRALVLAGRPLDEVLDVLDEMLVHERHADLIFATVALVRLHPDRRFVDLYLAGHPAPVLLGADGAAVIETEERRLPLGLDAGDGWRATTAAVDGASSLLLYSDGLIEGRIGSGPDRLGVEGLVELLTARTTAPGRAAADEELLSELVGEVQRLNGGDLSDDLAAVLLSWR
jgi:serine phosphatase RsbU (regulator of sigma subunit)